MAKKISLINMKGGVGKSTLAVNLAWQFAGTARWNKKVLVVDLDPQFNASQYLLGVNRYEAIVQKNLPTISDVFEQLAVSPTGKRPPPLDPKSVIQNVVHYNDGSRIDLIPSRLELAYSLRNPAGKEQLLQTLIAKLESLYDLVIFDCSPTESLLTTAAYLASDYILVPVKPEYLCSIGLPLLVRSLEEFQDHPAYGAHKIELAGVVFNATSNYAPEEMKAKKSVKSEAAKRGWYVFTKEVNYSRSYPKGAREGRPIFSTTYSRTRSSARMRDFAEELAKRVGL